MSRNRRESLELAPADTVSVIIPALNEATYLPGLLAALRAQSQPPLEIIVADAGSNDNTAKTAFQAGCRVVEGGRPARGRNAGAAVARGDIFLFLDADVRPAPDFLARALPEFNARRLAVATCLVQSLDGTRMDAVLHQAADWYIRALRPLAPRAPGFCVFSRRWAHEAIDGFDETLWMAEDHDYARRVAQWGRFGVLHVPIPVSTRRLQSDGRLTLAARYALIEIHLLARRNLRYPLFDYQFGHHSPRQIVGQRHAVQELLRPTAWRPRLMRETIPPTKAQTFTAAEALRLPARLYRQAVRSRWQRWLEAEMDER